MADTLTKRERSRIMAAVKSTGTVPEMTVRRTVHGLGYRYRLHAKHLPGAPDLAFPARRKVIQVCGCFWHMHNCGRCRIPATRREYWTAKFTRNKRRDQRTRRALHRLGWRVLTIWECQLADRDRLSERICAFLEG